MDNKQFAIEQLNKIKDIIETNNWFSEYYASGEKKSLFREIDKLIHKIEKENN